MSLSDEERHRHAAAFGAAGAVQCGFCTPGNVMRVKALIDNQGAGLTRDQASRHLGAHLCRCTGYLKILDAVELGEALGDESWVQWHRTWTPSEGRHRIQVRATDGDGITQSGQPVDPAPNGAEGWHTITVTSTPQPRLRSRGRQAPCRPGQQRSCNGPAVTNRA